MLSALYRFSDAASPRLRVGVLLDDTVLPRHLAAVLEDLRACNFVELALVVVRARPAGPDGLGAAGAPRLRPERLVYDTYARWDARRERSANPLVPTDCAAMLAGVERLEATPVANGVGARLPADVKGVIAARGLDVLLHLGMTELHDDLGLLARYGAWSYHWGDPGQYAGDPPHVWELLRKEPLIGAALVARRGPGQALVLCKGLARTEPTLSVTRNRRSILWETAHYVVWKLHDLHALGWDRLAAAATPLALSSPAGVAGAPARRGVPGNARMAAWLASAAARTGLELVNSVRHYATWKIGLRVGAPALCERPGPASLEGFRWITPPRGHYHADPFLLARDGKIWLFYEDFTFDQRFHVRRLKDGRGVIRCAEVLPSGDLGESHLCLDNGKHLSYPMVFTHGGETYLVPESGATREVALYRATSFPDVWQKEAVLFDACHAADTTVFEQDGTWWFFTSVSDGHGAMKLLLFYADALTGAWRYHPDNPISSDVRDCRCAGAIVRDGARLFRSSQSSVPEYGTSFALHEILELSRERYRERRWCTAEPDGRLGLVGTHTYNRCGPVEVTDGRMRAPVRHQDVPRARRTA